MPNIKSVAKDVKKSAELKVRNMATRSRIKTLIKKTKAAVAANDESAGKLLVETVSTVDRAAKQGIIHKNAAARRKSRLMKKVNKAGG